MFPDPFFKYTSRSPQWAKSEGEWSSFSLSRKGDLNEFLSYVTKKSPEKSDSDCKWSQITEEYFLQGHRWKLRRLTHCQSPWPWLWHKRYSWCFSKSWGSRPLAAVELTADLEWKSHRTYTDSAWPGRNFIAAGRVALFTLLSLYECVVARKPSNLLSWVTQPLSRSSEWEQRRHGEQTERRRGSVGKQINW